MIDALLTLQPQVTKTATFNGAALILPGGTPRRNLYARVIYSAAANASGNNSVLFSMDISYDGGTTWNSDFEAPPLALSTTVQSGEIAIPFDVSPTSVVNGIQVRLTAAFSGSGTTPTITYQGDIMPARP
jgi:hypothetical protein